MSYGDDGNLKEPERIPNVRPEPGENPGPLGWLDALNAFLDRALRADIDTGC